MRAPAFWWAAPGIAATLLRPSAAIYGSIAARRLRRPGRGVGVPVICVGNVTVGGAGKTPSALALAELAAARGFRPGMLLRGYGGRIARPVLVDLGLHDADAVGDEALLLARSAPTAVARDRIAGAALLRDGGADLVIMDDGMQNPSVRKDLTLAVFDGAVGMGNGLVLPAGPLRAPVTSQWPLIDAVLVVGPGPAGERITAEARRRGKPVLTAWIGPEPQAAERFRGARILAFAGIGRPEKFFETLRALGAEISVERSFGDHQALRRRDVERLAREAARRGLRLVTTEKDSVRLGPLAREFGVETLPVRLVFDDPAEVGALLDRLAPPKSSRPAA